MKGQTPPHPRPDAVGNLIATARRLLEPDGCAWDRVQTVSSLLPYLVEETWEVFESVRARRPSALRDELGDVLYTVLFLALLAERRGWFTLEEMADAASRKMIRRHPHVFGSRRANSPGDAYRRWQQVKRTEGTAPSGSKRMRPLLMELWNALHAHPATASALRQTLRGLAQGHAMSTGRASRSSGR